MKYLVVFDITNGDFMAPVYTSTGLIAVLTAIVFVVARKSLDDRAGRIFSWLILCVSVLWKAYAWVSTNKMHTSAITALVDGRASVVAGRVANFKPMPQSGHQSESFCVESHCFHYSDFEDSVGFNTATSRGGPIKPELPVRITFIGNTILKLEIARGS